MVVLWGGFEGTRALIHFRQRLVHDVTTLRQERDQAKLLLVEAEMWKKRRQWLESNQPKFSDSRQESVALLDSVENKAKAAGLHIESKGMGELEESEASSMIPIKIQVTGEVRALTKWFLQLQQPSNFMLVRKLTMKAAAQDGVVNCDLELLRCYSPQKAAQ